MLTATHDWIHLFDGEATGELVKALPDIMRTRRWFGGKARHIRSVDIVDCIAIPSDSLCLLLLIRVQYEQAEPETYTLPVTAAFGDDAERIHRELAPAVIAPFVLYRDGKRENGLLYDALWNRDFALGLLNAVSRDAQFTGVAGCLTASSTDAFPDLMPKTLHPEPVVMNAEQSNTSVAYNRSVILKVYRRVEAGINLDLEMSRALTHVRFPYVPLLAGALEYQFASGAPLTLGVLQQFAANDGNAWQYSMDAVNRFFQRLRSAPLDEARASHVPLRPLDSVHEPYAPLAGQLVGEDLGWAERLGRRTAQLHRALSQLTEDPAFAPEPLTRDYQRARRTAIERGMAEAVMLLNERTPILSRAGQEQASRLARLTPALEPLLMAFEELTGSVMRIRCHGDYHLGQVLCTKADFMIIDFEGEPARSLAERRMKHPVLLDIAGMIRSFHYVPCAFVKEQGLEPSRWSAYWSGWMSSAFVKGYLSTANGAECWPDNPDHVALLLDLYLVEKALYELRYELNNRPAWVDIPLNGLMTLLSQEQRR